MTSTILAIIMAASPIVEQGQQLFNKNCMACHGADAKGGFGPNIIGSSRELVEARTQHVSYPAGYKPKVDTHFMPVIPLSEEDITAIASFLNSGL